MISSDDSDLGCTNILRHNIETGNAALIFQQVHLLPLPAKESQKIIGKNARAESDFTIQEHMGILHSFGKNKDG